jgi:hypothetical protein
MFLYMRAIGLDRADQTARKSAVQLVLSRTVYRVVSNPTTRVRGGKSISARNGALFSAR